MPLSQEDQRRASAYRKALGDSYNSMIESWPALWEKTQKILREWLEAREQDGNDHLYELLRDWVAHVLLQEYLDSIEKRVFRSHSTQSAANDK